MSRTPLAQFARQLRIADPALATASDRQLLFRSRSGADDAAFAELVRRHERAVLAACRQVLTDPSDIEDAFQATFLALIQQAKRVRCDTSLSGWLFAVAHRIAVRAVRSRTRKDRREKAAARPAAVATEPTADLSWREAVAALHEALDELPDRFRLPLVLCYLDGLSREEAATQLGWTPGSVKAGLERGREKLRAALDRRGVTLSAGLLTVLAGVGSTAVASPELFAATLRVVSGSAPTPILELARPTMIALKTKAKFLFAPVTAAALCVGLLAAGKNEPLADPPRTPPTTQSADSKTTESKADKPILIAPDRVGTAEPGTLAGRVTGPDGKPVANATVSWQQKPNTQGSFPSDPAEFYAAPVTGKTDADGRFKLDVMIRGRTPFRTFNPWAHLIVQADGYPNPSRSHFQSMAIWHTARFGEEETRTSYGWLGRALDDDVGESCVVSNETPQAVRGRRSAVVSLTRTEDLLLTDPAATKAALGSTPLSDDLLGFVRRQAADSTGSAEKIAAMTHMNSDATYPTTGLGQKLKLVARMLKAGSSARIYYTAQGGYDTHAQQQFTHSNLLYELAGAVAAFFADLSAAKVADQVALLTFSEFGRTIQENGSLGTDHGTAGCVFLAGPGVKGGVHGTMPSLTDLAAGEPKMTTDFRRVYAAILSDWLGLPTVGLGGSFAPIKLFA